MYHKRTRTPSKGFTLVEIVIVMSLFGIITTIIYTFYNTSLNQYLGLQQEGISASDMAQQSQRVAMVLRGTTDITAVANDDLTLYAYFSPSDQYVSEVRYYLTNNDTRLVADVTHMTANPPEGTLIPESKKTFTIIDNYYKQAGVPLFSYLDSAGNPYTLPISDLHAIKGIKVKLVSPITRPSPDGTSTTEVQVSLRNRKTNL